jgi:hypothetical protein
MDPLKWQNLPFFLARDQISYNSPKKFRIDAHPSHLDIYTRYKVQKNQLILLLFLAKHFKSKYINPMPFLVPHLW